MLKTFEQVEILDQISALNTYVEGVHLHGYTNCWRRIESRWPVKIECHKAQVRLFGEMQSKIKMEINMEL